MSCKTISALLILCLSYATVSAATLYVDDDAPNDPGPGDPTVSDPLEDGTAEHPYDAIQEALAAAASGALVRVYDGVYSVGDEGLNFPSHQIALQSVSGPENCKLVCGARGLRFDKGQGRGTLLEGFTIADYAGPGYGAHGTIEVDGCSPTIRNCVVTDGAFDAIFLYNAAGPLIEECHLVECSGGVVGEMNNAVIRNCLIERNLGVAVYLTRKGSVRVENCMIVDNCTYYDPMGVVFAAASDGPSSMVLSNCTIGYQASDEVSGVYLNGLRGERVTATLENCIVWGPPTPIAYTGADAVDVTLRYCDVHRLGEMRSYLGELRSYVERDCVSLDPRYLKLGYWKGDEYISGDYRLATGSCCIDAGDPAFAGGGADFEGDARLLHGRVDIGADEVVQSDLDGDWRVTLADLAGFASAWGLQDGGVGGRADYTGDGEVALADLKVFTEDWLLDRTPVWARGWRWTFDQTWEEASGAYQPEVFSDPEFIGADQARIGGGAVELDGNDYLRVSGHFGVAGAHARTVTAWLRTTFTGPSPIMAWGESALAGSWWNTVVYPRNGAGVLAVGVGGAGVAIGATPVNTGEWIHVAVVLPEGGTTENLEFYVDGVREEVEDMIVESAEIATWWNEPLLVGCNGYKVFRGQMDDVRLYPRALSVEEIQQLAGGD